MVYLQYPEIRMAQRRIAFAQCFIGAKGGRFKEEFRGIEQRDQPDLLYRFGWRTYAFGVPG